MSEDALEKKLDQILEKQNKINDFIESHDKITNKQYCEVEGITRQTLFNWFAMGCPRVDNRHVLKSKVNKWKAEKATRKPTK